MDLHPPQGFHQRKIGGRNARQRRVSNTVVILSCKTPLSPCISVNKILFLVFAKNQACNPHGFDRIRPQHAAPASTTAAPTLHQRDRSRHAPTTAQGAHPRPKSPPPPHAATSGTSCGRAPTAFASARPQLPRPSTHPLGGEKMLC